MKLKSISHMIKIGCCRGKLDLDFQGYKLSYIHEVLNGKILIEKMITILKNKKKYKKNHFGSKRDVGLLTLITNKSQPKCPEEKLFI